MTFYGLLLALAVSIAAPAQPDGPAASAAPRDTSTTLNNSENRALAAPPGEEAQLARVPGGKATPRSEWKSGDLRGKTPRQKRQAKRKAAAP